MFKRIVSAVIAITMVMGMMCSCSESSSSEPASPNSIISQPDTSDSPSSQPDAPSTNGDNIELTANYSFAKASDGSTNDADFISGLNGFSSELFKNAVKSDLEQGKNTLISAESVAFALGMTANGAKGNTLKQMQDVMAGGVELDKFNKNMNLLISNTQKNNTEDSKLNIANSVWVKDREDLVLTQQFAKNCKEIYNAEMFRAPFDNGTLNKLNGWVNDKTDKMIPKILENFTGDEIMCLVNCIAFDSKWDKQYTDKQVREDQKFTNFKGDKVTCTMFCSTEKNYVENGRATGFVKNYKGGKYAFMAVLPNDNSIADYVSSMTKDEIAKLYAGKTSEDVITKLPSFTYDYDCELSKTLSSMGMSDAFSNPDFTNLFEKGNAAISKVIHKTHIELDAKGTKAAAATVVTMKEAAIAMDEEKTKQVILDRPFVYAIMDTETGLPVFMGTVCDPSVS